MEQDPQNLAKVRRFLAEALAGIQEEAQPAPAMHPPPTPPSAPASAPSKPAVLAASAVPASPASAAQTPALPPRHTELRSMQAFPSAMPSTASTVQAPTAPAPPNCDRCQSLPQRLASRLKRPLTEYPSESVYRAHPARLPRRKIKALRPCFRKVGASSGTITDLHKRWWFWTAIGTVTAGVIVGAALGAYAREPSWPGVEAVHPFPWEGGDRDAQESITRCDDGRMPP